MRRSGSTCERDRDPIRCWKVVLASWFWAHPGGRGTCLGRALPGGEGGWVWGGGNWWPTLMPPTLEGMSRRKVRIVGLTSRTRARMALCSD